MVCWPMVCWPMMRRTMMRQTMMRFLVLKTFYMTREDLEKQYAALSTNELLTIVDRKFGYTELAVTVAIEEMNRRNISEEDIKSYKEEQISQAISFVKRNIVD